MTNVEGVAHLFVRLFNAYKFCSYTGPIIAETIESYSDLVAKAKLAQMGDDELEQLEKERVQEIQNVKANTDSYWNGPVFFVLFN